MKKSMFTKSRLAALVAVASLVAPIQAQTSGSNGTHDPSRLIECDGKVYSYGTGGGGKVSSDGLVWAASTGISLDASWIKTFYSGNTQGLWAPDGIRYKGQYFLFYSFCGQNYSGKNTAPCAVGVKTTPTLDPKAANYKLTDQGMVVSNNQTTTFGAIDPYPFVDATGNLFVCWGGGFTNPTTAFSIWATKLDPVTGLADTTDPVYKLPNNPGHPIVKGHKEGSGMQYHAGYYYVFWNVGGCCSGITSSYTIHMSRAQTLDGQFTDDKIFYGPGSHQTGGINGPGHIGIYQCGESYWFSYHYYPTGGSIIGVNTLTWGSDGWPVAGPQITSGLKLPCATGVSAPEAKFYKSGGFNVASGASSFDIYDIQGKLVKHIAVASGFAGWNKTNAMGKQVPAGIYFAKISGAGKVSGQQFFVGR